jgi:amino acid transporter
VAMLFGLTKRVLVGRPMQSEHLGHTLLPKKIALPVFASDALSSVAYATEEILLVLSLGGIALLHYAPYIGAGVGLLMLVVVASYRQNVHAYPSGGGDYEVASTNLGPKVGLAVASALMVDYTLTVAVSVSAGVANLASAFPILNSHVTLIAVIVVAVLTIMNLRGVRESGTAFAIPTYFFIGSVGLMIVWGITRIALGHHLQAESAGYHVQATSSFTGLALVFLLLKAFSSGCTALTGVEAISNGVPAFKPPKSKNAASTLAMLGIIAVAMFAGVTVLAMVSNVHVAEQPSQLHGVPHGYVQPTVIAQVGQAVFGAGSPLFYILQFVTALILVLAANTAFNGFPVLASILSKDGYLPRQLHNRGDRLAFSNGILMLSGFAILLIVIFNASPTRLIQLYIIGVFVSFVCSQTGMIRHWNRHLKFTEDPKVRSHMKRTRVINSVGACVTGAVLVIVLFSKFASGAWIVVVAMPAIWLTMRAISRHYASVAVELSPPPADQPVTLPSSNRAIVLVSKLHLPTLRALAYARATQPSHIEAVTVSVDDAETARLREEWDAAGLPVPLTVVASPYRDITKPVVSYVSRLRRESPRDVVTVFIPEYVLGHWWEQLLHNQSALRLKAKLLLQPGVIVASVPYQLRSARSEALKQAIALGYGATAPGDRPTKVEFKPSGDVALTSDAAAPDVHEGGLARLRHHIASGHEQIQAEELQARVADVHATPIADLTDRQQCEVAGTLRTVTVRPRGNTPTLQAELWDGSGSVTLVWLGRHSIPGIEPGRHLKVRGRVSSHRGGRTIFNPGYELRPAGGESSGSTTVNR